MNRLLPLLLVLAACGTSETDADLEAAPSMEETATGPLGTTVPGGEALSPDELIAGAEDFAGRSVTVQGTVREVCQNAGCWLTLADADGRTVRVEVPRDDNGTYEYTFPTDVNGATVRLIGMLEVTTESVDDQRHFAEDGGATAEELEAITEPKQTLVLTALGAEVERGPAGTTIEDDALEA
ncbi:DUF4920 domain-containing protein [Rubrivirga sp.]|uniref:DUF4920 domain-containing protein n=1 Tax=Rubrivirga sp. TaxID=1885344 RepID=UPI003C723AAC